MQTDPKFTDGRSAILDPILECLNIAGSGTTYQRYEYLSDSIDREAVEKEHTDADGSPLGSDTREGFTKGSINLQLTLASDTIARPGHIIHLNTGGDNDDAYYVAGKFGRARTRNDIVKGSLAVKKCYAPIIVTLLTEAYGQRRSFTQAAGALTGTPAAAFSTVNTRTGSTLAYALAAVPGYTLPGWLSCNATTGALTGTAVAGTFEFDVVVTETLTGEETRKGSGRCILVIT